MNNIYIYTKACSLFNLLGMLKHVLDRTASIKIYLAFIWPILEYGSILRDNCSQENSNLLENVQIEAERIITRLKNSSRNVVYSELGRESLCKRRERHKLHYSTRLFMA